MKLNRQIAWVIFALIPATGIAQLAEEIAPQTLDTALEEFASLSGLQIVYESAEVQIYSSRGAASNTTIQQALGQLLAGTPLTYSFINSETVAIQARSQDSDAATSSLSSSYTNQLAQNRSAAAQPAGTSGSTPRSSPTQQPAFQPVTTIEEILITAQIREENLQNVPVSSTAFDAESLELNRFIEIDDIARYTPGLAASFFNNSSPIFAVRGANNTFSQAGASKPVGVFIDDVFVPRNSASSFTLFDLQQLTVLRGPQGTLFGRNVTGGAIQVRTAAPSRDRTVSKLQAGAGNYGLRELQAYVSGPFNADVAGKLSLSTISRDGFAVDRFTGQELDTQDSINLRSALVFDLTDDIELTLSADFANDENGGRSISFLSSNDRTDFTGNDGDPRTAELGVPQFYERDIWGLSAHLDWSLPAGNLQSITAYRYSEAKEDYSLGSGDVSLSSVDTQFLKSEVDEPKSLSQEIRFVSEPDENFDYVAGLYFYDEETDRFLGDTLLGIGGNATFIDRNFDVNVTTQSLAAYASLTFHLSPVLDLSVGGRYTSEEKDARVVFTDNNRAANNFVVAPNRDFNEFTPRLTLTYRPRDNMTLFASATEGFTAGGFNTETNSAVAIALGFEPETIRAYELGLKSSWNDNRVVANITAFHQKYDDKQEGYLDPVERYFSIFNASEATMEGVEMELNFLLTEGLTANIHYSALDAVYDRFVIAGGDNFSGNELQTAPGSTLSALIDYRTSLGDGLFTAGAGYSWQDDYYTGASNSSDFLIDDYGLLNIRAGYNWSGNGLSQWRLNAWIKNLTDEDFVRIRGVQGGIGEYYGPPLTYGISLSYEM